MNTPLYMIAAITSDRALGNEGKLICRDKNDMEHFKDTTMGQVVVMGRKTWDSLPDKFKPLPGRINIILTRDIDSVTLPSGYTRNYELGTDVTSVFCRNESKDPLVANTTIVTNNKDVVLGLSRMFHYQGKKTYVIGGGEIYDMFKQDYTEIVLTEFSWESTASDTKLFELDDSWKKDTRRCRRIVVDDKHIDFNYYVKTNHAQSQ